VRLEHRLGVMQGRLVPSSTGELQCSPGERWPDEFVIAADLGLAHVELLAERVVEDSNPIWSTAGRREICAIVAATGVDAPSLCMNEPLSTVLEGADAGTMLAARLVPVVCESPVRIVVLPLDEASGLDVLDWTQAAQGVRAVAGLLQERGARVALELNVSAADSMRFLDLVAFDTVGLCYDVGNATGLGYSAPGELRLLGSRVVHVHAKDKDATGSNVRYGTGVVPFGPVLAALREIEFDGLVTMEATRGDDPVITAAEHRAWLLASDEADVR
jgi:sugar phosphate isomerase/epimerase